MKRSSSPLVYSHHGARRVTDIVGFCRSYQNVKTNTERWTNTQAGVRLKRFCTQIKWEGKQSQTDCFSVWWCQTADGTRTEEKNPQGYENSASSEIWTEKHVFCSEVMSHKNENISYTMRWEWGVIRAGELRAAEQSQLLLTIRQCSGRERKNDGGLEL